MRAGPLLGALAVFFLLVMGVVVALALALGSSQSGHEASAVEWTIQILILLGALLMVAGRTARRS